MAGTIMPLLAHPNSIGRDRGAQGRSRTSDTRIFSPLLYQLSYLGVRLVGATIRLIDKAQGLVQHRPAPC